MSDYHCVYDLRLKCPSIPKGTDCNGMCHFAYQQGREDAIAELYENLFQRIYDGELKDDQIMYAIKEYIDRKGQSNEE